jgi:hypothetical protein
VNCPQTPSTVIPAKAGIQVHQGVMDPGSSLRYGRDDDSYECAGLFPLPTKSLITDEGAGKTRVEPADFPLLQGNCGNGAGCGGGKWVIDNPSRRSGLNPRHCSRPRGLPVQVGGILLWYDYVWLSRSSNGFS